MTTKPLLLCASGAGANPLLMACGLQIGQYVLRMQHAGLGGACQTDGSQLWACGLDRHGQCFDGDHGCQLF